MPGEPGPSRGYLLGSEAHELARLAFQHRVWAEQAFAVWRKARFGYGHSLVDLGCGPGMATIDLAHLVGPSGRVVAVDDSRESLDQLERRLAEESLDNVEVVHADVRTVELAANGLDGAYARWLFCFLSDPDAVVARVAAALRPGAALAVTDYFNYGAFTFAPRSTALDLVVAAVEECWRRRGGDLDVQAGMPRILHECGLELESIDAVTRVARPGSAEWNWPKRFFRVFLPTLEQEGLVGAAESEAFWHDWAERESNPAAYLLLPTMVDVIGRKPRG